MLKRTLLILHVFVVLVLFGWLFVVDWYPNGWGYLPLAPRAVAESGAGKWVTWKMENTASDEALYFYMADYLLRGKVDPKLTANRESLGCAAVRLPRADSPGPKLPYKDITFEYPPLATVFLILPGLWEPSLYHYKIYFSLLAGLGFLVTVWIGLRTVEDLEPEPGAANIFLAGSLAFVIAFGPIIVSRLDVFAVLLVALALRAMQKGRFLGAGVWLALGVATKLYPLIFLPFFLVAAYRSASWKAAFRILAGFVAVLVLVYVPIYLFTWDGYLESLRYHSDRGVEIESLWASWAQIRFLWGVPTTVYDQFGSTNVTWVGEAWVRRFWTYFALFALGAAGLQFLWRKGGDFVDLVRASLLAVLALLATSKVLSNQYILWIFPLFLLIRPGRWVIVMSSLVIALASQLVFPTYFAELQHFDETANWVLAIRNVLLVALFFWLFFQRGSPSVSQEKCLADVRR